MQHARCTAVCTCTVHVHVQYMYTVQYTLCSVHDVCTSPHALFYARARPTTIHVLKVGSLTQCQHMFALRNQTYTARLRLKVDMNKCGKCGPVIGQILVAVWIASVHKTSKSHGLLYMYSVCHLHTCYARNKSFPGWPTMGS